MYKGHSHTFWFAKIVHAFLLPSGWKQGAEQFLVTSASPDPAEVLRMSVCGPLCEPHFHWFCTHTHTHTHTRPPPIQYLQPLQILSQLFLGITREGLSICSPTSSVYHRLVTLAFCFLELVLCLSPTGLVEWECLCADCTGIPSMYPQPPSRCCCLRYQRGTRLSEIHWALCTSMETHSLHLLYNSLSSCQSNIGLCPKTYGDFSKIALILSIKCIASGW